MTSLQHEKPHAFQLNLETNAFFLEQTTSTDFEPLYEIASNPVVWEQHPEKDRWKRPIFSAFFQGAMENDLGCFTIRDKSAGIVIGTTRFYSHDVERDAVRLGYTFLCPTYWGSGANQVTKEALLEHAFTVVGNVHFDIGKDNFRSRKAVEKLGAVECAGDDEKVVYGLNKDVFSQRAWGVRRTIKNADKR